MLCYFCHPARCFSSRRGDARLMKSLLSRGPLLRVSRGRVASYIREWEFRIGKFLIHCEAVGN